MYKFSRLMLAVAFLEFLFCVLVVAIVCWPWPLLILVVIMGLQAIERRKPLWTHGTAQWADITELRRTGMIGGGARLSIGRLDAAGVESWSSSLGAVFDRQVPDKEACERPIRRLFQVVFHTKGETVHLSKSVHTAVFGPTGMGKGASFIIPWLKESTESAIVLDYKGECASITARHREKSLGHRVVLLDPFCIVTQRPDCFNPVDFIDKESANWMDDCRDLAEQLVVRTGEEREPHWNESAEMWIGGAIAAVVLHAEPDNRSLQTVRDVLSNPDKIPQLLELLCQSEGLVARLGGQLAHFRDKELSSTLTTANRHLRFLDTPAVAANTTDSSFDPRKLRDGRMTIYCILPPEHMRVQAALIRMWVGSLMRAVVQGGLQHG